MLCMLFAQRFPWPGIHHSPAQHTWLLRMQSCSACMFTQHAVLPSMPPCAARLMFCMHRCSACMSAWLVLLLSIHPCPTCIFPQHALLSCMYRCPARMSAWPAAVCRPSDQGCLQQAPFLLVFTHLTCNRIFKSIPDKSIPDSLLVLQELHAYTHSHKCLTRLILCMIKAKSLDLYQTDRQSCPWVLTIMTHMQVDLA